MWIFCMRVIDHVACLHMDVRETAFEHFPYFASMRDRVLHFPADMDGYVFIP